MPVLAGPALGSAADEHLYAVEDAPAGAQSLTIGAGGLVAGPLIERLGLRRFGAVAAVTNTAAFGGLLAATLAGEAAMAAAAALVGLTQPQVGTLLRLHWSYRSSGRPDLLTTALSYEAAADEVSFVAGPAAVGLLAGLATPAAPLSASAALLIAGGLPLAALGCTRYSASAVPSPASPTPGCRSASALRPGIARSRSAWHSAWPPCFCCRCPWRSRSAVSPSPRT